MNTFLIRSWLMSPAPVSYTHLLVICNSFLGIGCVWVCVDAVSYTHLDVYKRQVHSCYYFKNKELI